MKQASTSSDPASTPRFGASSTAAPGTGGIPSHGIETRSIDHVPHQERHGRVWPLSAVWVAGNANVGTLAVGMVGIAAGAGVFWTLLTVIAGCAFGTIFAALHSTQGPHLGLPQLIQSRPQFGYLGAIVVFVLALVTYVGFNVFVNILGGESLQVTTHAPSHLSFVLVSLAAAVIALVGYDWIHHVSRAITILFGAVFAVITVATVTQGALTLGDIAPTHFNSTAVLLQFGAAAGYQINWAIYVSDYTRYLPKNVSSKQMFSCTYLGMTISAAWFGCLGTLMIAGFPRLDAVTGTQAAGNLLASHFGTFAVLVGLIGLVTVAAMNTYGGALTLISLLDGFIRIRFTRGLRLLAIATVTVVALALSLVASSNFLTQFGSFLTVLLYLFAPWTAINLTDYFLIRRGHYSITEMFNPAGMYGRWNTRGLVSYGVGFLAEIPFANTAWYQGPICKAIDGADIAPFIGLAVGFALYMVLYRNHDLAAEQAAISAADSDLLSGPTATSSTTAPLAEPI